jgi:hypothetical protein
MAMTWADRLLYVNLAWYAVLAVAFLAYGNVPKALYFLGATILTLGIILTP